MSDQPSNVFEQPAPTSAEVAPAPTAPTVPDSARGIVGEGKKYSSVESALSSIEPAQSHISNLEAENARLRGDLERASKLDDVVSQIEANKSQTETPSAPVYDPTKMREEVRSVYTEISVEQARADNVAEANDAIYKMYGDKAPEVTASVPSKLGVSVDFLQATAETSPSAFMKLIADTSDQGGGLPHVDQPSINSDALNLGQVPQTPTAKVGSMSNTKDVLAGWRGAGKMVEANNN